MAYWLVKTEASSFSWDDQVHRGVKGEPWTGVRNHTARRNLKAMKRGDRAFFYHSGDEKRIVGIVEVIKEEPRLADMVLVHLSRLSVQPVTAAQWRLVCRMGGLKTE